MKKDATFRSLRYSRDVLGVDLGSHTIKVIQLKVTPQRTLVVDYAQKEVWPLLAEAKTPEESVTALAGALKALLKSRRFGSTRSAVALSGNQSLVKFLAVSKGARRDSRTGVPEEALALSPFEPQDTALEMRALGVAPGETQERFLVALAQKSAITEKLAVLRNAGLRPSVVVNDALALETAFGYASKGRESAPALLVNIGAATTTVAVFEAGSLRAVRTFNIAGDTFTRAIKREFLIETAEAEALKKEYGLYGHRMVAAGRAPAAASEAYRIYNETAMRAAKALAPVVKDLALSIQRTAATFLETRLEVADGISGLFLSGGGAQMKGLTEVLIGETHMPTEVLRPLSKAFVRQAEGLDKESPALAVAFGLGLSGALRQSSSAPRLNLLPPEAKRAAALRNSWRVVFFLGLLAGAGYAGRHFLEQHQARLAESEAAMELALKAESAKKQVKAPSKAAAKPAKSAESASASRFAHLRVTGSFGDMVMLSGGRTGYVAKEGRLFDDDGQLVPGVVSRLTGDSVVLTVQGERFVIALPK